MSHMAFIFSLLTVLGAVWVAFFGLRPIPHRIPPEPVAVGLATFGDLHAGAVGGFTEFADGAPGEQLVGLLVVIFSILTFLVVAFWILRRELPFGLKKQYHEVIVLTGPVAAALAGLMSFSTTCKLLERYTYADALASGYEKNFVAPTV